MSAEQIKSIAEKLAMIAGIFNPAAAASLTALLEAGTELNDLIAAIRSNDPELWARARADVGAAIAAWDASVIANAAAVEP